MGLMAAASAGVTGDELDLWIQATNPMVSLPNLSRYRSAAGKEDRFIVVSEAYPTPTTDVADVILPAAMWIEREGVFANVERRMQHFERMVAPPGEATGDAWQMIEVARRLGFEKLFPYDARRHVEQRQIAANVLRHPGAQRPTHFPAVLQRPQIGPFQLFTLPRKPLARALSLPRHAHSDCNESQALSADPLPSPASGYIISYHKWE